MKGTGIGYCASATRPITGILPALTYQPTSREWSLGWTHMLTWEETLTCVITQTQTISTVLSKGEGCLPIGCITTYEEVLALICGISESIHLLSHVT